MHRPAPRRAPGPANTSAHTGSFASRFTVNGLLVLGCAYMVVPVLWLLFASTKNTADLYGTSAYALGRFALFENIAAVAAQDGGLFFRWLGNSVLYAGFGAVFGGLVSVMAGYAFDKFQFRGKNAWFGFVLLGVLIPNTATVLPMYLLASVFGITNTVWAILIPVLCNPFGVYLARVYSLPTCLPKPSKPPAWTAPGPSVRSSPWACP
jgi:multiple sugar transport system permease protein